MPSAFVCNLEVYVDADVSMRTHVAKTIYKCFAVPRHLCSICCSVFRAVPHCRDRTNPLGLWKCDTFFALVLTHLDYGNATLAGLTDHLLVGLQSFLNAAACSTSMSLKFDHVMPLLRELYWLRFPDSKDCKLAVLVFKCLNGLAPSYLGGEFHRVADTESRQ